MSGLEDKGGRRVDFSPAAKRQRKKLPEPISEQLAFLLWDLEHHGPLQPEWSHYGPLKKAPSIPSPLIHIIATLRMDGQPMWFAGK